MIVAMAQDKCFNYYIVSLPNEVNCPTTTIFLLFFISANLKTKFKSGFACLNLSTIGEKQEANPYLKLKVDLLASRNFGTKRERHIL